MFTPRGSYGTLSSCQPKKINIVTAGVEPTTNETILTDSKSLGNSKAQVVPYKCGRYGSYHFGQNL